MKHFILIALHLSFISITSPTVAQELQELTLKDAVLKRFSALSPKRLDQLQWIKGTDTYSYVVKKGDSQWLMKGTVASVAEDTLLSMREVSESLKLPDSMLLKRFPYVHWLDSSRFYFHHNNTYYKFNLPDNSVHVLLDHPKEGAHMEFETNMMNLAYTVDNNIHISTADGRTLAITNDNDKGIVNGQIVHRNEFGISKGMFWSPKGNYLAFYRKDETMVTDYPIVDISTRPASVKMIKYPMAGMSSHQVTLGVYDFRSGSTVFLKTGDPKDHYLTCVSWGPQEKYIYIAILNREQNHMWLNKYDAHSGAFVKTLFEETHEKYVEPDHALIFLKNKPEEFMWFSERDGYRHLYLYNTDGRLIRQLTKGKWVVLDIAGIDEETGSLFVRGTGGNPTERHIYRVDMQSGQYKRLTRDEGSHFAIMSDQRHYLIDVFSNLSTPRTYKLLNSDGRQVKQLLKSPNPLKDYKIGNARLFTIKAEDGTPLWCRMIKPADFDKGKKYPALVYVYNGPRVQLVLDSWLAAAPLWMYYMAEQGFVIFTVDGRGSENRGRAFEQATFRHLGKVEVTDQLKGVEYLKSLPFIDAERLGVHGWSYGGFMTVSLMMKTPGVFKVGVAGGPVIDWKYYEVMYTERYMDTPQTNPEGYIESSLLNDVDKLQGKLLTIHGTADDVVVMQHNISFLKACIDKGVQTDFFVYPGHPHNVRGKDRYHLMKKVLDYISDNLQE